MDETLNYNYTGMSLIFKLTVNDNHEQFNLSYATKFSNLSNDLKKKIINSKIKINPKSEIIYETKYDGYRIIDTYGEIIECYYIKIFKIVNESDFTTYEDQENEKQKFELNFYKDTLSGTSPNLSNHQIFQSSLPVQKKGSKKKYRFFISADINFEDRRFIFSKEPNLDKIKTNRSNLDNDQKARWDYFFRPNKSLIGKKQKKLIKSIEDEIKTISDGKKSKKIFSGLFGFVGLFLSIAIGWVPLFFMGLSLAFIYYFSTVPALQKKQDIKNKEVRTYNSEIDHLLDQVPSKIISDNEIIGDLNKSVRRIEKRAISELALSSDDLHQLDSHINPLNLSSIHIMQWGTIQPHNIVGKDRIAENHRISFYVTNQGTPLFGVYYFQYIFLSKLNISVYSCFYDLILDKTFGVSTNQYFYKDIVSIGTTSLVISNPYDENEEYDTTTLQIAVSNNNPLQIAVTDEKILTDLNERIRDRKEIDSVSQDEEYLNLDETIAIINDINTEEEGLPSNRAMAAMSYVRREWARLKAKEDLA